MPTVTRRAFTLPILAAKLGVTPYQFAGLVRRHQSLSDRMFLASARRMWMSDDLPAFESAVRADRDAGLIK